MSAQYQAAARYKPRWCSTLAGNAPQIGSLWTRLAVRAMRLVLVASLALTLAGCGAAGSSSTAGSPSPLATTPPLRPADTRVVAASVTDPTRITGGTLVTIAAPIEPTRSAVSTPRATPLASTRPPLPTSFARLCQSASLFNSAGHFDRLVFKGQVYALVVRIDRTPGNTRTEPSPPPVFALGQVLGTTVIPWQAANTFIPDWYFPAGTPIYSLQGLSPDLLVALQDATRTFVFCAQERSTLLTRTQVVRATVQATIPDPPAGKTAATSATPTDRRCASRSPRSGRAP